MAAATELNRCRNITITTIAGLVTSLLIVALTIAMMWTDRSLVVYPTLLIAFVVLFPLHDHTVIKALGSTLLPNVPVAVLYAATVVTAAVGLHIIYHVSFLEHPGARIAATVLLGLFAALAIACTLLKYTYATNTTLEAKRCDLLLAAAHDIASGREPGEIAR